LSPRCAYKKAVKSDVEMYISPDTKHKALCATQIVVCTTTYAAAT